MWLEKSSGLFFVEHELYSEHMPSATHAIITEVPNSWDYKAKKKESFCLKIFLVKLSADGPVTPEEKSLAFLWNPERQVTGDFSVIGGAASGNVKINGHSYRAAYAWSHPDKLGWTVSFEAHDKRSLKKEFQALQHALNPSLATRDKTVGRDGFFAEHGVKSWSELEAKWLKNNRKFRAVLKEKVVEIVGKVESLLDESECLILKLDDSYKEMSDPVFLHKYVLEMQRKKTFKIRVKPDPDQNVEAGQMRKIMPLDHLPLETGVVRGIRKDKAKAI